MKAPSFAYVRARSLSELFELLEDHGDGARLLAGGQSLLAMLNLRLSFPEVLIDITRVPGLSGIKVKRPADPADAPLLPDGCDGGTALLVPFQLFTGKLAWLGD